MDKNQAVALIGSNHRLKGRFIESAMMALSELFQISARSEIVKSFDVEGSGTVYANLVCLLRTGLPLEEVSELVKGIERRLGRSSCSKARGVVEIDIDIVIWNDKVIRPADASRPYFSEPYAVLRQNIL